MDDRKKKEFDSQTDQTRESDQSQTEQEEEITEDEEYFSEISPGADSNTEEDEEMAQWGE